ncbi:MAG: hypothetical protein ACPGOV_00400 [Magnetovibrionaceae bacterium]
MPTVQEALNFESESSSKTKGNRFGAVERLTETINLEDAKFCASTDKLIELEYNYCKENTITTINQRGAMMRVFLAVVSIASAGSFALINDGNINEIDLFAISAISLIVFFMSLHYMRGLLILRSDWHDYITSMAVLKIFLVRLEEKSLRRQILESALFHDPLNPPSRNLKTNFFYHSYIVCSTIAAISVVVLFLAISYLASENIEIQLDIFTLAFLIVIIVIMIGVFVSISGRIWNSFLKEERNSIDVSPLDRQPKRSAETRKVEDEP